MTSRTSNTVQLVKIFVSSGVTIFFILCGLGVIGSIPTQTKAYEGGEWTYGASGGRTYSRYMHPDEWHRTGVRGRRQSWSECVAPGEIARASTKQSLIGRNKFYAEMCEPSSRALERWARRNAN